jgi:predicted nucleotidyltransferase
VSLTTEQKQYLQLPFVFEECTASKDQILFTYYLALYNIKKLMTEYMNPNKNQSERTFIIANSFAKASESERFRFVSAVTAGFHHMGEPVALDFFLKTIHTLLPHANNNPNFEEVLESMTLDEITTRFIKILRSSASYHAKTSMNVGEIVSRWYIEEELIPSTEADSSTIKTAKRQFENKINNLINKFLKRDLDNTVPLELDKPPVEITGEEQEGVEFNCTFGRKKNLIVQSTRTKNDIYKYSKNEFVEYYTFSYPQWASPHYSLSHVLKDSDVDLITQIHIFNNLDRDNPERMLRSTGDSNSKDPMRTAMVFWIPIDYIRLEGPELGEIVIHNNTLEKTEKALEEFCIGGASEENLRLIQLTSNIHNMNEPNDRLLIPYSILKTPYKRKIDENSK